MSSFYSLPLAAFVVMALNLRVTNASAFQLNECPVGCSSHGSCHEGLCDCGAGWSGQDCSYFLAGSGAGEEDPLDEEEECVDECSAHGTCSGGICKCAAGWGGLSCNIAAQCPETCKAPNGQCNAGSCVCAAGFFGPQCADALCPQNCFGHGSCNSGACECAQGWFGRLCDSELDAVSMCDPPCSNSGQCVSGQCYCGTGFTGIDCSLQVQVTPAQASALAAAAPVVETSRAPPMQIPSTVSMANKLQELQEELQDVSHKTQKLQAKHAKSPSAPHMHKKPLMLAQVDGSVPNWAMEAVYPSQQQSVAQAGIPSGLYPARLAGSPPAVHRGNFAASRPRETIPMPVEVASPPQPAAMQANLNAVRRATAAAGDAADKLRRTAQKEFATAANNRMQHAYQRAHAHEKNLPGYQAHVPTPVAAPVLDVPAAQTPIESLSMNFKPNFGASPPVIHAGTAKDSDNEDSEDTESQEELDPVHNLDEEALQASQRLHGVTHMMVSAMRTPVAKCEADCGGHGMCVRQGAGNACKCAPGWVGMLCDTARCENDCNGRGLCLKGHCLCGKGWLGSTCGHLRCPDDCSGVGYCFAGRCRCKTGYDGANCAQVKPAGLSVSVKMMPLALIKAPPPINPHFEGMTLRAVPAKLCPDNCNGRGHCSKEGECMCNVGYSGLACELFCPNECSHQGDCIEGACLCFAGFLGVDCSIAGCCSGHGTCDDPGTCVCDTGWDGDDCSVKLMCPDPGCSGHGTCTSGKCICAVGFSGGSCAIADGACVPPCGPAGACNPISHKCECQGGAAGPTCLESISSCPKNCNNRGLCMNGACMCGAGFMGADCGKKFFKPGMKPPPPAAKAGASSDGAGAGGGAGGMPSIVGVGGGGAGAPPAAGGGAAADDDEDTGDGTSAYSGKSGAAANAPMVLSKASGGIVCGDGGLCSGHGTCNTELARCDCVTNFFGEVCERQHCAGFFQKRLECNGHGLCEMGECQCAPGFGMATFRMLERPIPPQQCFDKVCPVGCGMHGKCVEGQCVCQQGWQGVNCKDPQCPNDCAGHGQCVFQSVHSPGQCTCNYGWGGAGCQRVAVYAQLKSCANDCSGNGLCMDGMCACNVGFKGPDCSDIVCSGMMTGPKCDQVRCPNDCNGRGLCLNGMCACWSYYAGKQCRIPVACVETCGELCETPGQEQKCNNCIGMCESSAPRSSSVFGSAPLGSHNPFEDLQSTLLQQSFKPAQPAHGSEWIAMRQNQSHGHPAVEHAANKKKRTSHSHHEVYQRLEKASFAQVPHAASQHHAHHHKEVSATIVTAF